MWMMHPSWLLYLLGLSGWLALLAGFFFVLCGITIRLLRRYNVSTKMLKLPRLPFIAWKTTKILSELPGVAKFVTRVVPVVAAFILGYGAKSIEQFNHRETYRVHVLEHVKPYGYWVQRVDEKTNVPIGPEQFQYFCQNGEDPKLEDGEFEDITSEIQGQCDNIYGPHLGWNPVRDEHHHIIHIGAKNGNLPASIGQP